ncbi:sensor histidine kinase [Spiractinospora alimapuensis]|nr:sensor histidine kinase [Spiractinospora alimapuensis]
MFDGASPHGGPPFGPGYDGQGFPPQGSALGAGAYVTIVAAISATALRRVAPRVAFVGCAVAVLVFLALGNPYGPMMFLLAFVTFSAGAHLPPRRFLPWTVVLVGVVLAGHASAPYLGLTDLGAILGQVGALFGFGVAAAFGMLLRARRESVGRERAAELDRHAYSERLRIAQEVHDVVGHSLSVINMQAGVALHVLEKRPEQSAVALEAIRATSKEALDELRGTLAVFRDATEPGDAPAPPLAGLARLDELVESVRAGGRRVSRDVEGDPSNVSATVDHAAFRIVQEALTNAVRHAGDASVWVTIRYGAERLVVDVTDNGLADPAQPPRDGNGLAGMRERAEAVGGWLRAAPRTAGGFEVHAELPVNRERERGERET